MKEYKRGSLPRIKLPVVDKATPEELQRRRDIVARILERRRRIGPVGVRTNELLREVRDEAEGG